MIDYKDHIGWCDASIPLDSEPVKQEVAEQRPWYAVILGDAEDGSDDEAYAFTAQNKLITYLKSGVLAQKSGKVIYGVAYFGRGHEYMGFPNNPPRGLILHGEHAIDWIELCKRALHALSLYYDQLARLDKKD